MEMKNARMCSVSWKAHIQGRCALIMQQITQWVWPLWNQEQNCLMLAMQTVNWDFNGSRFMIRGREKALSWASLGQEFCGKVWSWHFLLLSCRVRLHCCERDWSFRRVCSSKFKEVEGDTKNLLSECQEGQLGISYWWYGGEAAWVKQNWLQLPQSHFTV